MSNTTPDAFAHHPELRGKIADPLTSFFRTFGRKSLLENHPNPEVLKDFLRSDIDREANRHNFLAAHGQGDLWVFGYGSLMWDPGFQFSDVRRASVAGHSRQFILVDDKGGRGTVAAPGLMAALDQTLDESATCQGLGFRIAASLVGAETEILWQREMVGFAYLPVLVTAQINNQPEKVLTFKANHAAASIRRDLSRADQIRYFAQGQGFLGSSKDYLANIVRQFALLGIVDDACTDLLREVEEFMRQSQ